MATPVPLSQPGRRLGSPPRRILACALVLAFAGLGMTQLNELHRGMHGTGEPSFTLGDLDVFRPAPDYAQAEGVLRVWRRSAESTAQAGGGAEPADAYEVTRWFVLLDSLLFAPFYALGLVLVLRHARRRIAWWRREDTPSPDLLDARAHRVGIALRPLLRLHQRAAAVAIGLILATAVADWAENWSYLRLVDFGWEQQPDFESNRFRRLVQILWVASGAKWLLAVFAVLLSAGVLWILLAEWLSSRGGWQFERIRGPAQLVGPHVLLVTVFGTALLAHEQLPDLIRRWTLLQLVLSTLFAAAFALGTWLVTRRLLVRGVWQPRWTGERRARVRRVLFAVVAGAAAVQVVLHALSGDWTRRPGWGLVIPALALVVLALLGLLVGGRPEPGPALPLTGAVRPTQPRLPRVLAAAVLVLFGYALAHASFGYAVYSGAWTGRMFAPIAGGLIGVAVRDLFRARGTPALWAALGASATAVLAAWTGEVEPWLLVGTALVLPIVGWLAYDDLALASGPAREFSRPLVLATLAALVVGAGLVIAFPVELGQALGVVAVFAVFMLALAVLAALLLWVRPGIPVPRALVAVYVTRFPLFTALLLWFVLASVFDPGGHHDLRLVKTATPASAPNLAQAFDCWLGKNALAAGRCAEESAPEREAGAAPLFLVASTGGGIRAAFWTALVLDCAFEVEAAGVDPEEPCQGERPETFERSNALFALSGISGGSVGFAAYTAHLVEKAEQEEAAPWLERRLSVDGLSPTGLWWLFVEFPRGFLQFELERDRSEILERSWEQEWPGGELKRGLFALWRRQPHLPLLFLNGTSVEDGCRFSLSVLNANVEERAPERPSCRSLGAFDEAEQTKEPEALGLHQRLNPNSTLAATRELADFVCGRLDVPLSSAAFLSARFPFVNPSGRLESRCPTGGRRPVAYVVDGGYLDTSGASPLVELSQGLGPLIEGWNERRAGERCIVPFLIQIDNGFEDPGSERAPRRPLEFSIPLTTVFATRIGRAAQARTAAALLFNSRFRGATLDGGPLLDRYAHFVNQAHPGPRAPLGWAQSRASEDELRGQLRQRKNIDALREVRGWVTAAQQGRLTCAQS